jgi:hypothetical protein
MLRHQMTVDSARRALGYRNHTPVSLTIDGKKNLRKVLQYLKDQGCPEHYLDLPKSMEKAA